MHKKIAKTRKTMIITSILYVMKILLKLVSLLKMIIWIIMKIIIKDVVLSTMVNMEMEHLQKNMMNLLVEKNN